MKKIVLFASGNGSNVENIIQFFKNNTTVSIVGIFCNNPHAKVLERAENHKIKTTIFNKNELNGNLVLDKLKQLQPDLIVLAGFLLKFPENIIKEFPKKIINIHPALLPKYGGKGMYGMKVHQAVIAAGDTESGITIHHVNEHYDEGDIIFQARCSIAMGDTPENLAAKIHELEYEHFPRVIHNLVAGVQ